MFNYDPNFSIAINLDFRYRNFLNLRSNRGKDICLGDLSQQGLERNRFPTERHLIAARGAHLFSLQSPDIRILLSEYIPEIEENTTASHLLALFDPVGDCAHPFDKNQVEILNDALAPAAELIDAEVFDGEAFTQKYNEFEAIFDSALTMVLNWIRDHAGTSNEFAMQMVRAGVLTKRTVDGDVQYVPITLDQAKGIKFDLAYSISIQAGRMPQQVKDFMDKILFVLAFRTNDVSKYAFLRMTDAGSQLEQIIRAENKSRQVNIPNFFQNTVDRSTKHSHFHIRLFLLDDVDATLAASFATVNPHQKPSVFFDNFLKSKAKKYVKDGHLTVTKETISEKDAAHIPKEILDEISADDLQKEILRQGARIESYKDRHLKKEHYITEDDDRSREQERSKKERKKGRSPSKVRKVRATTLVSKIEHSDQNEFIFDNLFYFLDTNDIHYHPLALDNVNLDFLTALHIYYTSRNQIEEPDADVKHLFGFQRALQFVHNFHYDSNEFTVTKRGFINAVDVNSLASFQDSYAEPTPYYVDFIIGVLSYLKSGHHATSANIVNMATKVYGALGYSFTPEIVRQRIRASLYHGGHPGSIRMQLLYIHYRNRTEPLSNAILLRLNTNPPLSMPFLNLALYIEGLAKVQFFRNFGPALFLNINQFRDNIGTVQKLKHYAAPYANYLYGKTATIPSIVIEQILLFAPLARALTILLPNSSLNMSASLRKLILQAASIDIGSDITVQAYITTYRTNIRTISAEQMQNSSNLIQN